MRMGERVRGGGLCWEGRCTVNLIKRRLMRLQLMRRLLRQESSTSDAFIHAGSSDAADAFHWWRWTTSVSFLTAGWLLDVAEAFVFD